MVTRGVLKTGLIWLLVICVSGCATPTDFNEGNNLIPDEWSAVVPPDASGCSSINGDYQKGLNSINLSVSELDTKRLVYYELKTENEKVGRKMIIH